MTTAYRQDGQILMVTLAGAVSAGGLLDIGTIVGLAEKAGVTGDAVPFIVSGIVEAPKAGMAFTQGALLYNSATGALTTAATGNVPAGIAAEAAASGDSTGLVHLNFGK